MSISLIGTTRLRLAPKRRGIAFRHLEFLTLAEKRVLLIVVTPEGGGVFCEGSPHFRDVIVSNNAATGRGGGLYVLNGSPTLEDAVVSGNTASQGSGLYILDGDPVLEDVSIRGNEGSSAIFAVNALPVLRDVAIEDNKGSGIQVSVTNGRAGLHMTGGHVVGPASATGPWGLSPGIWIHGTDLVLSGVRVAGNDVGILFETTRSAGSRPTSRHRPTTARSSSRWRTCRRSSTPTSSATTS